MKTNHRRNFVDPGDGPYGGFAYSAWTSRLNGKTFVQFDECYGGHRQFARGKRAAKRCLHQNDRRFIKHDTQRTLAETVQAPA